MDPALSYASGPTDSPLLEETIGAAFDRTVAAHGDRAALVDRASGLRYTYRELAAEVDALARGLSARGIGKGDRVGIWSPNRAEWVVTQFATAKIGAVLVTVNPAYRTHELAYVLRQAGIRLLVSAPSFKTSDYRGMVGEVCAECPDLEAVVFFDGPDWDEIIAAGAQVPLPDVELSPHDPINIQYTSGTTGFPKGATLSHRNILNNGWFVAEIQGWTHEDRVCLPVPFYHCFGMVMGNLGAISHGSCMVVPAPAFEAAATLRAVRDERCTVLYGVPTMFIAALAEPDFASYDLSSLRTGVMAGAPCPVEVMKRVIDDMGMTDVTICYGMTETSPVSTQTRTQDSIAQRVSTVGGVHPHVEIKVVAPDTGEVVPRGEAGELCTRGYSVMLGYWSDPEKTAEAVDADGWMHTGDLATMDGDGYLNIVGRIKDMVIRGGENLYPREIEEFLYTHPDVVDAQVIGVPDEKYGEELMAWVKLRPGAPELTPEALRGYCAGKLAHFKIPRYVRVVDEFPMTVTGKIRKVEMREQAIELLGLDAAARTEHA
jgi:fatty-acyl-CoA synthase